jgi:hypothetical protein
MALRGSKANRERGATLGTMRAAAPVLALLVGCGARTALPSPDALGGEGSGVGAGVWTAAGSSVRCTRVR